MPALLFFTDPVRTPDPCRVLARLPRGAAVVFRAFGAPDAADQALRLRRATRKRGLLLLVGADARLAATARADGVHLPERLAPRARALKAMRPGWIVTCAAHGAAAARRAAQAGADALIVSPVFPSKSPSAGRPLGPRRLAVIARGADAPVYALGGVNERTAASLRMAPLVGLAGVEALAR